jgi:hypothetical protein
MKYRLLGKTGVSTAAARRAIHDIVKQLVQP